MEENNNEMGNMVDLNKERKKKKKKSLGQGNLRGR